MNKLNSYFSMISAIAGPSTLLFEDDINKLIDKPDKKEKRGEYTSIRKEPKTRRNEFCPCDSGKKYKKCCGSVK